MSRNIHINILSIIQISHTISIYMIQYLPATLKYHTNILMDILKWFIEWIMHVFWQRPHLSDSSDVLHDHVVSSLEMVEFNIRLDCCKEHIAEKWFKYLLLYLCLCFYPEFYLRPWDTQWPIICQPTRERLTSATLSPNCLSEMI